MCLLTNMFFEQQVEKSVGQQKAQGYGAHFMEVSAKENVNIEEVFFSFIH